MRTGLHDVATGRSHLPNGVHTETTMDGTVRGLSGITVCDLGRVVFLAGPTRWTVDGATDPIGGSLGFLAFDQQVEYFTQKELNNFRGIRDGSVNGVVQLQPFKRP